MFVILIQSCACQACGGYMGQLSCQLGQRVEVFGVKGKANMPWAHACELKLLCVLLLYQLMTYFFVISMQDLGGQNISRIRIRTIWRRKPLCRLMR